MIYILISIQALLSLFISIRERKVCAFRKQIIQMCSDYYLRNIDPIIYDANEDPFVWILDQLPGYNEMLFSFVPLDIHNWLTYDQIDKLQSK